jgi:hypothetical protein
MPHEPDIGLVVRVARARAAHEGVIAGELGDEPGLAAVGFFFL